MKKLLVEFIGTFFLVLAVLLNQNAGVMNLVAIGATLMVMIYAGGHISGAHYNPAVTLAVWLRNKISTNEALSYIGSQLLAAVVAVILVGTVFGGHALTLSGGAVFNDNIAAIFAELLGTFALAYVVLNIATAKANAGNSAYGLAIGFTVTACGYLLGKYSGGAFNPAVALAIMLNGAFSLSVAWVYILGCFGGAGLAAVVFNYLNAGNKD